MSEKERDLTDVAERSGVVGGRRIEERKTEMFRGEFVSVVDAVVTAAAERRFVGGAKHRCLFVPDVASDLHRSLSERLMVSNDVRFAKVGDIVPESSCFLRLTTVMSLPNK